MKLFFRLEIHGGEHLKAFPKGAILAGNHTGLLDSFILMAAYPTAFRFLVHESVLDWEFIGPWVGWANTTILFKKNQSGILKNVIREMKQGSHYCIFPEGTLTKDGKLNPFEPGVAFLQEKTSAPIIPFAIHGGFESWPEGQRWPKFRRIYLSFGSPIYCFQDRETTLGMLFQSVQQLKCQLAALEAAQPAGISKILTSQPIS